MAQVKAQAAADQQKITTLLSELDEYKASNHDLLEKILQLQPHSKVKLEKPKKSKNKTAQS